MSAEFLSNVPMTEGNAYPSQDAKLLKVRPIANVLNFQINVHQMEHVVFQSSPAQIIPRINARKT